LTATAVFSLHLAASLAAYWAFGRSRELPALAKFITIIIYLSVPVYVAVQAAPSAIYLSDALAPILALLILTNKPMQAASRQSLAILIIGFLLLLPAVLYLVHGLSGSGGLADQRDLLGALLWYYRQCTFALLFLYGLSLRLDAKGLSAFVHLNFLMGSVLVAFACINYIFNVNLAVLDQLLAVNTEYGALYLEERRVGYGFLGLFRASAGQWCATLAILLLGVATVRPPGTRLLYIFVAVCLIGCVLATLSRAGIVSLAVGLFVLSLFGTGWTQRLLAAGGLSLGGYLVIEGSGTFIDRIASILEASDDSSLTRLNAWALAIEHLSKDTQALFLGIGPANDRGISFITGTWGAHNELLDVALKLGIFGLILWLMVIASLFKRINSKRRNDRSLVVYSTTMLAVLAANISASVTQTHLLHSYSTYTVCAFLFWLYGVFASQSLVRQRARNIDHRLSLAWRSNFKQ
jgi:hypothetical protein